MASAPAGTPRTQKHPTTKKAKPYDHREDDKAVDVTPPQPPPNPPIVRGDGDC